MKIREIFYSLKDLIENVLSEFLIGLLFIGVGYILLIVIEDVYDIIIPILGLFLVIHSIYRDIRK